MMATEAKYIEIGLDLTLSNRVCLLIIAAPICGLVIHLKQAQLMKNHPQYSALIFSTLALFTVLYFANSFSEAFVKSTGLSLDSLHFGCGIILMINGFRLINYVKLSGQNSTHSGLIPTFIPLLISPAVVSNFLILNNSLANNTGVLLTILMACASLGLLFLVAQKLEETAGQGGLYILNKLNGLYLLLVSSQMVFLSVSVL